MSATFVLETAERLDVLRKAGKECVDLTDTLGAAYEMLATGVPLAEWQTLPKLGDALIFVERPDLGSFEKPNIDALLALCKPSNFGKGNETVHDPAVRDSNEIVFTQDLQLNIIPLEKTLRQLAASVFGKNITLTPDKLVVYSVGGHFDEHRDTVRHVDHVGTCVVALGGDFDGGGLRFITEPIDDMDMPLSAAVFFTDVPHEVLPVTRGHRVVVTLRITAERIEYQPDVISRDERSDCSFDDAACDRKSVELVGTSAWLSAKFVEGADTQRLPKFKDLPFALELQAALKKHPAIIVGCRHLIPASAFGKGLEGLRGTDKELAEQLRTTLGLQVAVVVLRVEMEMDTGDELVPSRRVFAMSDDPVVCNFLDTHTNIGFVRSPQSDHLVVRHAKGAEFTGNEGAPMELQYICIGLLVQP